MKKVFLLLLIISMVAVFYLIGCKAEVVEEVEEEAAVTELEETVPPAKIKMVMLTHWTEPWEMDYWDRVYSEYNELHPELENEYISVEFEALYEKIMTMRAAGEDPEITHVHQMWIPAFVEAGMLAEAPDWVASDIEENFSPASVEGVTYNGGIWGYPTEYNSWFLVYNKVLLEEAGYTEPPKTWEELHDMAIALTKRDPDTGEIIQTGFSPFYDGMPEEQMMQFATLLWTNGGELWDLTTKKALFNDERGIEAVKLYTDLINEAYNPEALPDFWWDAWAEENVAMMILPTWMSYTKDAMEDNFTHLGLAPVPVPEEGMEPVSLTYGWVAVVSKKAEESGTAEAAWEFLKWMNEPKPLLSCMGEYLTRHLIIPARISDQEQNPVLDTANPGFWFRDAMEIASNYGRSYKYNAKFEEIQFILGTKLEEAWMGTLSPEDALNTAAAEIEKILEEEL